MARGRYEWRIEHEGLHQVRIVSGPDRSIVEQKGRAQLARWDEQWARLQERERRAQERQDRAQQVRERQEERETLAQQAVHLTREAQERLAECDSLLAATLNVNDAIDWESLKDRREVEEPAPIQPVPPRGGPPNLQSFLPKIGLAGRLFPWKGRRLREEAIHRFRIAEADWDQSVQDHKVELSQYDAELEAWRSRGRLFRAAQAQQHRAVDEQQARYLAGSTDAIEEYCDLVLSRSSYPEWCPKDFELEYRAVSRTLVIEYQLPAPSALPRTKEVRLVARSGELKTVELSEAEIRRRYDSVLVQIMLRTVHEVFEADTVRAIDVVSLNGWVESLDPSVGHETRKCVASLSVAREAFLVINLAKIDPRACFKKLKGVAASELHALTPVAPVMTMDRADKRFVHGKEIVASINEGSNLAGMDWQDFEHLIRELFEKEFAGAGGEVKVTQASRDGGVDAVIFDPDPIRGGKIVVQAKRYTNTVSVSAVRDLYGTVLNEGANKGILVATSDFGPDSYDFAKDKPLVLLSGSNLLHLLSKHGVQAHIDLVSAKEMAHKSSAR